MLFPCSVCPGRRDPWPCTSEKGKKAPGEKLPAVTPVSRRRRAWQNLATCHHKPQEQTANSSIDVGNRITRTNETLSVVEMCVSNPDSEKPRLLPTESFLSDPSDGLIADDL